MKRNILFNFLFSLVYATSFRVFDEGDVGGNTDPEPNPTPTIEFPEWMPEAYRTEGSFSRHAVDNKFDAEAFFKASLSAQKNIGKGTITKLGKDATDEEIFNFRKEALGVDIENYKIADEAGFTEGSNQKELADMLTGLGKESGIPSDMMRKLYDNIQKKQTEMGEVETTNSQNLIDAGRAGLKKEWGDAYQGKVSGIKDYIVETMGEEFFKTNQNSIGTNFPMLKVLSTFIGKVDATSGDNNDTFGANGGSGSTGITPAEAQSQINAMRSDPSHPYNDEFHVGHQNAVDKMAKLYEATL